MRLHANRRKLFYIVGILAAAGIVYLAAALILPQDATRLYYRAEKKNFDKIVRWVNRNYTTFMENQQPYRNDTYRRHVEVTADIGPDGEAFGFSGSDKSAELIKGMKLVLDSKRQPQEGAAISDVSLLYKKAPLMDARLFSDKESIYITIPVLMPERYFRADPNRLDEVYDKFSIPIKPKKLPNKAIISETLAFDAAVFEKSAAKLGEVFKKYFTKETVVYDGDREVAISGQTVNGKEVIVTVDEKSATDLLGELTDIIIQDDALLQYTYGNFADLSALLDDAGLFRLFGYPGDAKTATTDGYEKSLIDKLNIKKDIPAFKRLLKEASGKFLPKGGLRMVVVIDSAGNILSRKMTLDLRDTAGGNSFLLEIGTGASSMEFDDARNRFVDIAVTEFGTEGNLQRSGNGDGMADNLGERLKTTELYIMPVFGKDTDTKTGGAVSILYTTVPAGGSVSGIDIELDISPRQTDQDMKRSQAVKFHAKYIGDTGEGIVAGELNNKAWENKKLNSRNRILNITVNADIPFLDIHNYSAALNITGEDRFGTEAFTLPDVQKLDVFDLNAATGKDLDRLEAEIMASFGTFYLNNKPLFDAFLGQ